MGFVVGINSSGDEGYFHDKSHGGPANSNVNLLPTFWLASLSPVFSLFLQVARHPHTYDNHSYQKLKVYGTLLSHVFPSITVISIGIINSERLLFPC